MAALRRQRQLDYKRSWKRRNKDYSNSPLSKKTICEVKNESQWFFVDDNNGVNRHKEYYQKNKEKTKNSAKNYRNVSWENVNAKRRIAKFLKKGCSTVETFLKLAKQGPDCVCAVCNRCFYPRSVTEFKCDKYNLDLTNIIHPAAVNSTDYICKACNNILKKSCIPVQVVCNKFHIFLPPDE